MTGRHFFIVLEPGNENYYASCNILNDESLMYVYLLHPQKGSLLFTLFYDYTQKRFINRFIVPGLDKTMIGLLNDKISEQKADQYRPQFQDRYKLINCEEQYSYFVINRIFQRGKAGNIASNHFHVFHEDWEGISEYEWDLYEGCTAKKGKELLLSQFAVIDAAIASMGPA